MITTFSQILKDLQKKQYQPVYFLSGEEPYYIDKIADQIELQVLNESEKAFNQTVVYGRDVQVAQIIEMVSRFPMFAEYVVVIVKEAQDLKKIEDMASYLTSPNPSAILVFCYKNSKIDKRTKLYTVLKENACFLDQEKVRDAEIVRIVNEYIDENGFKLSTQTLQIMLEHLGNDVGKILMELEKLMFIKRETKRIDPEDIEKNIGISREYNVFELQNAVVNKDAKKLAKICTYLKGDSKAMALPQVIATLFTHFSKAYVLAGGRNESTAKDLGVQDWQLKDIEGAARAYGNRIPKVISILHEYDLRFKGVNDPGTKDYELMKEMVFRIINC